MDKITEKINRVLAEWDPIGVGEKMATDEYKGYIPMILQLFPNRKQLMEYLDYTLINEMGIDFKTHDKKHINDLQKICDSLIEIDHSNVYENSDKRRLYWLINQYIIGNINESLFCDEFYYCYDLGIDRNKLNSVEKNTFKELDEIVSRFSPYKEDHLLDPKAFTTTEELHQKIIETHLLLEAQNVCKNTDKTE